MTKEELEEYENKIVMQEKSKLQKEAENYLNQNCKRWESDSLSVDDIAIENYLASAEPRENKIADIKANCDLAIEGRDVKIMELEQQIEKIKCCGNCRFSESDTLNGTFCHREGYFVVASAKCKLWEM